MGRVLTNEVSLSYAVEEEGNAGTLPGDPVWRVLEPNGISEAGASINTIVRNPISRERQRKKGAITDLDSALNYDADLTIEQLRDFIPGFLFSQFVGPRHFTEYETDIVPTASGFGYTAIAGSALATRTLVFSRGWTLAENNGLFVVDTGSTTSAFSVVGTSTSVEASTTARKATVSVCGFRGQSGDLEIDSDGNLTSTNLDFTTLGLKAGQFIYIGGEATANQFATAANSGLARIVTIAAAKLTLDKKATTFVADNGSGKEVDIYFGDFIRNVDTQDADYKQWTYQFEGDFPGLASNGVDSEYEYSIGNFANQFSVQLNRADKATCDVAFVGTDSEPLTTTRKTNADNPVEPEQTAAFNTTSDVARLRITEIDETGLTTDFKSLTLTINNNVSPEKVIGSLGARFMNAGNFEFDIEAEVLFTSGAVVGAIRNNTTLTMDFLLRNSDGGFALDVPAITLGGGGKNYPTNESVAINLTVAAFRDSTLGSTVGISMFPYLPPVA